MAAAGASGQHAEEATERRAPWVAAAAQDPMNASCVPYGTSTGMSTAAHRSCVVGKMVAHWGWGWLRIGL